MEAVVVNHRSLFFSKKWPEPLCHLGLRTLEIHDSKIYFYRNIVCENVYCVTALRLGTARVVLFEFNSQI